MLSDIQILIAPLLSFGHCVVWYTDSDCPFCIFWSLCCLIYRFWLPLWYLLVIVLSDIQILIAPLLSFGHCVVWYTDSDFPFVSFGHCVVWYTDSDCPFAIFWSLCCLIYRFWFPLLYLLVIVLSDIQILIAPLVSFGHCVVWYTDSDCPFAIFWSLCCLIYDSDFHFGIFWSLRCLIYGFWLPLWYLFVIGHCVVWYTDSDFSFGIFWSLCCLIYRFWFPLWYLLVIVFSDIQILISPLLSFGHCVVWYTDSDCPVRIFWSLCCLIYRFWLSLCYLLAIVLSDIQILIASLVSLGHCVVWYTDFDCPFAIFGHCVVWYTDSDCPFGIFRSLCCLIYRFWLSLWYHLVIVLSDIQILIASLVSFGHCVVWYTDSDCPFGIFWSLCCLIYIFWLPLCYLLVIVLSVIQILIAPLLYFGHCVVWYTDYDCPFGIFWSLCCLIYRFWLPFAIFWSLCCLKYGFWLPLWYLLVIGHCVVWYTDSDCPFGIFWSLCCLIYRFWLPLCYLLVIVLSDIRILISPLVSFGHCVVWYTDSDYHFGIFW